MKSSASLLDFVVVLEEVLVKKELQLAVIMQEQHEQGIVSQPF